MKTDFVGHTPGPWRQGYNPSDGNFTILESKMGGRCVGLAFGPFGPRETTEVSEANAWLLAAAPELLEALESVERTACFGHNTPHKDDALFHILEVARAAIAAAKGVL